MKTFTTERLSSLLSEHMFTNNNYLLNSSSLLMETYNMYDDIMSQSFKNKYIVDSFYIMPKNNSI